MTEQDKKRATSLLVSLLFAGGCAQARALRAELEHVHGVVATLDRVRADLAWLANVGMLQQNHDTVALTEEGRDVAQGRRTLP